MTIAVFDFDVIAYRAASAAETRSIKAYHPISGDEFVCKTRSELYGHWSKKEGGLLAEFNLKNKTDYKADELVIIDVQTPENVANALHTTKTMVESVLYYLKTNKFNGYLGKGDSFRVERSTLLKYKGSREGLLRPMLLGEVRDYIIKKYSADVVEGLEADDWLCIDAYRDKSKVCVTNDKDARGTACLVYNPFDTNEQKIVDCHGFGSLYLNNKGEVKGTGRLWLYQQLCSLDAADNYKANCFSDIAWGEKSAYKALKDCKTDKEAFTAVRNVFTTLYPEPKTVVGWRGDEILIDWKYVANEMFDMCRMKRTPTEEIVCTDVMRELEVIND